MFCFLFIRIYAGEAMLNFRKGLKRKRLLERADELFYQIFYNDDEDDKLPKLPIRCVREIISHLGDDGVKTLVNNSKHIKLG